MKHKECVVGRDRFRIKRVKESCCHHLNLFWVLIELKRSYETFWGQLGKFEHRLGIS